LRRPECRRLRQHREDPGDAAEGYGREGPATVARAVRPVHRRVRLSAAAPEKALEAELAKGTRLVARRDPAMARLIKRVGKLDLRDPHEDPFAALGASIMYQQLAGAAATAIHNRFIGLFPKGLSPRAVLALK